MLKNQSKTPFLWKLTQWKAALFPFRTLRLAESVFAKVPSGTTASRPLFGFQIHLDVSRSSAQRLIYLLGESYLDERKLFREHVRPNMRVVDIGANIGFTMLLLRSLVGNDGEVVCVEPSPENLPELRANIERNGLRNVVLHDVAVGATDGTVGIRSGINGGILDESEDSNSGQARLTRLDSLISSRIDFLKIDVDGYEGFVLEGCNEVLEKYKPTLLLEMHPHLIGRFGHSTRGLVNYLRKFYSDITAYETPRPGNTSLAHKVVARYVHRAELVKHLQLDDLLNLADSGCHNYTFWLICKP